MKGYQTVPTLFFMKLMICGLAMIGLAQAQGAKPLEAGSAEANLALALGYRWLSFFEVMPRDVAVHLSGLEDNVLLDTPHGRTVGINDYKIRLANLPPQTRTSHLIRGATVWTAPNAQMLLRMAVRFHQRLQDGTLHAWDQDVEFLVSRAATSEPQIQAITITSLQKIELEKFEFSSDINRLQATILYWLAMLAQGLEGNRDHLMMLTDMTWPEAFIVPGPLEGIIPEDHQQLKQLTARLQTSRFEVSDCKEFPAGGLTAWATYEVVCALKWSFLERGSQMPRSATSKLRVDLEDRRGPFAVITGISIE